MLTLSELEFAQPQWWWLFPAVCLFLFFILHTGKITLQLPTNYSGITSRFSYRHPDIKMIRKLVIQSAVGRAKFKNIKIFVFYAVLAFLVSASMAQPYKFGKQLPEPPLNRDIMFIVDTSISMVLRDYVVGEQRVSRLEMMKGVLAHFVDQLQGNRIGIVAFSEQAYTVVPLTTDYHLLKTQLARLDAATLTGRTNNLAHGLLYTYKQLASFEGSETSKPVLVLVTNANRPARDIDPTVVASFIRHKGYRLHTIAIGSPSYKGRERNSHGLIYHPANFKLIKDVANAAEGKFYWAKNTDSLKDAIRIIQQAEQRKIKVEARYIQIPFYHWPIKMGLIWILLWQIVSLILRLKSISRSTGI